MLITGCTKEIEVAGTDNSEINSAEVLDDQVVDSEVEDSEEVPEEMNPEKEIIEDDSYGYFVIDNPSWKKFNNTGLNSEDYAHVTLTQDVEDSYEWLDTEVWCEKNGFEYIRYPYSDDNYTYEKDYPVDDYSATELYIYDRESNNLLYDLDMIKLCSGPDDEEGTESYLIQDIGYSTIDESNNMLYVSIVYNGYSSELPVSNHIVAIDLDTKEVVWRSEALVANSINFQVVDDTIICGYGFTSEPDYIYLLDKHTGDKIEQIKVASAPEYFGIKDDKLYVATYNTAYEYTIKR